MTMLVNDAAVLLSLHEVAAGGQPLKKRVGGAGGGRSASPRNAFHVVRRCLCALASVVVDWHNVIVEKTVVCSFFCIAIVAFFQVLFAFALPLL